MIYEDNDIFGLIYLSSEYDLCGNSDNDLQDFAAQKYDLKDYNSYVHSSSISIAVHLVVSIPSPWLLGSIPGLEKRFVCRARPWCALSSKEGLKFQL